MSNTPTPSNAPILSVRPREAARITGLGVRLLWSQTAPRGPIPAVRVGKAVLYRLADLDAFLAARAGKGGRNG